MGKYYFSVSDYLHIACTGKHSVKFLLKKNGKDIGEIFIVDGVLWDAIDSTGEGEDAFMRMIFMKDVEIDSFELMNLPEKRRIIQNWEEILMRGVAERDKMKWKISKGKDGKPKEKSELTDVIDRGLECLMKKDYRNAIKIFSDLNRRYPGNILIQSKLNRLKELGYKNTQGHSEGENL